MDLSNDAVVTQQFELQTNIFYIEIYTQHLG